MYNLSTKLEILSPYGWIEIKESGVKLEGIISIPVLTLDPLTAEKVEGFIRIYRITETRVYIRIPFFRRVKIIGELTIPITPTEIEGIMVSSVVNKFEFPKGVDLPGALKIINSQFKQSS